MMRLINLNRISRTNIEENEDGYIFPYSFEDMIFENNFDVRIKKSIGPLTRFELEQ